MKEIALITSYPAFVSPFFLREIQKNIVKTKTTKGGVLIGDKILSTNNNLDCDIEVIVIPKSKQIFTLEGYQQFLINEEKERYKSRVEAYQKYWEDEMDKQACIALFYSQYNIPFKFHTSHKEVLSGLTVNSSGNGRKRNSKEHIVVDKKFKIGRLKRKKGDFLCSQSKSKFGANWSGAKDHYDNKTIVNCTICLARLEKFKKNKK